MAFLHVDILYATQPDAHAEALANLVELWEQVHRTERANRGPRNPSDAIPRKPLGQRQGIAARDLRARVKLPMHRPQPRHIDVRVNLRRGDAGMAEHLLHLPQIGPAGQQMGGEAVPQRVRTDVRGARRAAHTVSAVPKSARVAIAVRDTESKAQSAGGEQRAASFGRSSSK